MCKRLLLMTLFVALTALGVAKAQTFALKTNALEWATASFNIEPEVKVGKHSTIALNVSYNPWTYNKENLKWKHILVQPEYRYWFCQAFNGHFLGIHPGYAHVNAGGWPGAFDFIGGELSKYRYQGDLYSIGIGYGYHWIITNRFSMEAEIGLGAGYADTDYWYCEKCGSYIGEKKGWFFTPTKLAVSFIWLIK